MMGSYCVKLSQWLPICTDLPYVNPEPETVARDLVVAGYRDLEANGVFLDPGNRVWHQICGLRQGEGQCPKEKSCPVAGRPGVP
ncbi:MAG: hypothetical protein HYV63_28890 [Candidatus Schekmanbacteria bacterium]|nr:hypothetical protein [Candidatus Schekmanbacteria bacterium]